MSQLSRTFATAASSFASKRHYSMRMPIASLASPPSSPTSTFFLYHARTPSSSGSSQTQLPSPPLAPRSPSQMQYPTFPVPPRSPSQVINPVFPNQPLSPSQMQFSFGSPMLQAQQSLGDISLNCMQDIPATFAAVVDRPVAGRAPPPPTTANAEEPKKKRGLNAFTYYRKTFPERYPAIDRVIRTQKDRSTITGACWQAEEPDVKEFCRIAAKTRDRTAAEAERLEVIRQNVSNKRKKERAASGTDQLRERNLLLFRLWDARATEEEIDSAVTAYDNDHPEPEPSRKRRRTKPVRDEPELDFQSAPVVLHPPTFANSVSHPSPSPATTMSSLPVSPAPPSSLALSPVSSQYSPACSISSLPSLDMFAPQLSFNADFASARWDGLATALFAEHPVLMQHMSFEDQPAPVHACVPDLASNFDVAMQLADAGYTSSVADAGAPVVLGGEDNLENLCVAYSYPEHYGRPPADTLITEEDNGPFFDLTYLGAFGA